MLLETLLSQPAISEEGYGNLERSKSICSSKLHNRKGQSSISSFASFSSCPVVDEGVQQQRQRQQQKKKKKQKQEGKTNTRKETNEKSRNKLQKKRTALKDFRPASDGALQMEMRCSTKRNTPAPKTKQEIVKLDDNKKPTTLDPPASASHVAQADKIAILKPRVSSLLLENASPFKKRSASSVMSSRTQSSLSSFDGSPQARRISHSGPVLRKIKSLFHISRLKNTDAIGNVRDGINSVSSNRIKDFQDSSSTLPTVLLPMEPLSPVNQDLVVLSKKKEAILTRSPSSFTSSECSIPPTKQKDTSATQSHVRHNADLNVHTKSTGRRSRSRSHSPHPRRSKRLSSQNASRRKKSSNKKKKDEEIKLELKPTEKDQVTLPFDLPLTSTSVNNQPSSDTKKKIKEKAYDEKEENKQMKGHETKRAERFCQKQKDLPKNEHKQRTPKKKETSSSPGASTAEDTSTIQGNGDRKKSDGKTQIEKIDTNNVSEIIGTNLLNGFVIDSQNEQVSRLEEELKAAYIKLDHQERLRLQMMNSLTIQATQIKHLEDTLNRLYKETIPSLRNESEELERTKKKLTVQMEFQRQEFEEQLKKKDDVLEYFAALPSRTQEEKVV